MTEDTMGNEDISQSDDVIYSLTNTLSSMEFSNILTKSKEVSGYFNKPIKKDHLHDIVLIVGNQQYPAHKIVLTIVSPVFEKMFGVDWRVEEKQSLHEEEGDYFDVFFDFLYGYRIRISHL